MAEQLKYISENERLYSEETKKIVEALWHKLMDIGAKPVETYTVKGGGRFEIRGIYEFPRQGTVLFHFKELAKRIRG